VITFDNSQISVNQNGEFTIKVGSIPGWRSIQRVDFIEVPSMCRFSYCKKKDAAQRTTKGEYQMYCKYPSETMLEIQCDKCSGPHLLTQKMCSANLKTKSPLFRSKPGWYNVKTGQRLKTTPTPFEEEFSRSGNVSRVSFNR